MNVAIEDVSAVEKKITVTIPEDKVQRELTKAYGNLQGQVMLRGFRRGKVPRKVLEARFRPQIEGEVASRLVSDTLDRTIDEHKIFMVSRPSIDMGDLTGGDFVFTATIEVKPVVEATGYDGMELTRDVYGLDETIINNQLEQERRRHGSLEPVEEDRGLTEGDVAFIDYTLSIGGEVVEGPIENFQVEIRKEAMLPGFAEQVSGMKQGDERSFSLEAPETVPSPELAGKTLEFTVKLNEFKALTLPELNDELAKDAGHESLEEMTQKLRDNQRKHLDENALAKLKHEVVTKLMEANPIELPKGLVTQHTDRLVRQQADRYRREGAGAAAASMAESQRAELEEESRRQLCRALILESISKKEELEVTDGDLNARFDEMAAAMGQRPEALRGQYKKNNLIDDLKESILQDKTLDLVIAKANVTDVEKAYSDHTHDHDHGDDHDHHDH